MKKLMRMIATAATLVVLASGASAQNLVTNGSFSSLTSNTGVTQTVIDNYIVNDATNFGGNSSNWGFNLTGWTNNGEISILFGAGVSDSPNNNAIHSSDYAVPNARAPGWGLRGPGDGCTCDANSLTATSPDGGSFFGTDSNYNVGNLTQNVAGLTVGQTYTLSFWWAGGQIQTGSGLPNSAGWNVTFAGGAGTDVNQSVSANYPDRGFSGWSQAIYTFTASATSELLTFTPTGSGAPPISLLDGVAILQGTNVVPVPEPAEWALILGGLAVLGFYQKRRRAGQTQLKGPQAY